MDSNPNNGYYECFAFGDSPEMADELLALVLAGKKTATVSVVLEDEHTPGAVIPLPIKHLSRLNASRLSRCYNDTWLDLQRKGKQAVL